MQTTEKKYWINGHQVRGNFFHSLAFSILNTGILISIQIKGKRYFNIDIFRLV